MLFMSSYLLAVNSHILVGSSLACVAGVKLGRGRQSAKVVTQAWQTPQSGAVALLGGSWRAQKKKEKKDE